MISVGEHGFRSFRSFTQKTEPCTVISAWAKLVHRSSNLLFANRGRQKIIGCSLGKRSK
jgi:hypothetical protein